MQVILSTYNYYSGTVSADALMGEVTVQATPIGNKVPLPSQSCGIATLVMCVDLEVGSYVFIPWEEVDNWNDDAFYSQLATIADGKVYDQLGNQLGEASPDCIYHYAPNLKTLFCVGA